MSICKGLEQWVLMNISALYVLTVCWHNAWDVCTSTTHCGALTLVWTQTHNATICDRRPLFHRSILYRSAERPNFLDRKSTRFKAQERASDEPFCEQNRESDAVDFPTGRWAGGVGRQDAGHFRPIPKEPMTSCALPITLSELFLRLRCM